MVAALIESHYLPSLEYFCAIRPFDKIILENEEHYVKQSLRNRCYINTSQGREMLVVPLTGKHGKVAFKDIRIEAGNKWKNNHWRTITSAYAKAPFFEHYSDEFHQVIFNEFVFLCDLNQALLSICLRSLGMEKEISATLAYTKEAPNDVFDLRSQISGKVPYGVRPFYQPQSYYQVFGNAFAENLSLIDILFCEGPAATGILNQSKKKI